MPVPGEEKKLTSVGANGSEFTMRQDRSLITSRDTAFEIPARAVLSPAMSGVSDT